ncbi:MAG: trimeric intracellular cation channel family protein [Paracoccus sp. (in: a-proteobacteria)]|nr:trimeric intracellular cation channel family protein [Paracoccus sp. (in: a-proteobacteria)]
MIDGPQAISPLIDAPPLVLFGMDMAAATIFAATGALAASRRQMDVVGFIWLAIATGVGGGTVRDLILDVPVFWVVNPAHIIACVTTAIIVHFGAHLIERRFVALLWLDALGMALVTVAGTSKGLSVGAAPLIAVTMGVFTASVGGIIRDVLTQEPSIIMRREIYVTAALAGAVSYVIAVQLGAGKLGAAGAGFGVAASLRMAALAFGWSMPAYRPRAARDYPITDQTPPPDREG